MSLCPAPRHAAWLSLLLALAPGSGADPLSLQALARYSSAAYCPAGSIRPDGFRPGSTCNSLSTAGAKVFEGTVQECAQPGSTAAPLAFVTTDAPSRTVVVAFRGTDAANTNAVLLDIEAVPTTCKVGDVALPGVVHKGFCCYVSSLVQAGLAAEVQQRLAQSPGYQLSLTGHSLGGAAAQIAGLGFALSLRPSQTLVNTFGSPRVGDAAFDAALAAHTAGTNVVAQGDLVPSVPPNLPSTIRETHVPTEWACRSGMFGITLPHPFNLCQDLMAHVHYEGMEIPGECCASPDAQGAHLCMGWPARCQPVLGSQLAAMPAPANSTAAAGRPSPSPAPALRGAARGQSEASPGPDVFLP